MPLQQEINLLLSVVILFLAQVLFLLHGLINIMVALVTVAKVFSWIQMCSCLQHRSLLGVNAHQDSNVFVSSSMFPISVYILLILLLLCLADLIVISLKFPMSIIHNFTSYLSSNHSISGSKCHILLTLFVFHFHLWWRKNTVGRPLEIYSQFRCKNLRLKSSKLQTCTSDHIGTQMHGGNLPFIFWQ